eukprot:382106-Prorocentrum_minimum.AAC.1
MGPPPPVKNDTGGFETPSGRPEAVAGPSEGGRRGAIWGQQGVDCPACRRGEASRTFGGDGGVGGTKLGKQNRASSPCGA